MISLHSEEWNKIPDAYNKGENVAVLLAQIQSDPSPSVHTNDEPWFSLWSSICHQGDIYPASFAAVPHLADIASRTSYPIDENFFVLPAYIEISRNAKNVEVPEEFKNEYDEAIRKLTLLASNSIGHEQLGEDFLTAAQGMVLVGQGKFKEAEKIMDPESPDLE